MTFKQIRLNRIGIDIGGSLSKLVFILPEELKIDQTDVEQTECVDGE